MREFLHQHLGKPVAIAFRTRSDSEETAAFALILTLDCFGRNSDVVAGNIGTQINLFFHLAPESHQKLLMLSRTTEHQ
jgi:hypothetical protein